MKTILAQSVCAAVCLWACGAVAEESTSADALRQDAHTAVYGCSRGASVYITRLREAGPAGLEALFALREEMSQSAPQLRPNDPNTTADDPTAEELRAVETHNYRLRRLAEAIDAVGGQRDCTASRLYWHTDFDKALAAAQSSGKPILSLRMLGNLTDDLSCANSRFFRTTLYANQQVAETLRTRYILHWKSVRPVPKVTIDFGDGRQIIRTVTGNSIHYILDSQGRVVDALPGLYGPQAFLQQLNAADAFRLSAYFTANAGEWQAALARWHTARQAQTAAAWRADIQQVTGTVAGDQPSADAKRPLQALAASSRQPSAAPQQADVKKVHLPRAAEAAQIARPKLRLEMPVIALVSAEDMRQLDSQTGEEQWAKIAALHAEEGQLDAASQALIASKTPTAARAGELAITKAEVERPLARIIRNFQQAIALDTVRNEYQLHRQIHEWLAAAPVADVESLNERVYAELFLTPSSDPWLGLLPEDAYSALDNGGVVMTK